MQDTQDTIRVRCVEVSDGYAHFDIVKSPESTAEDGVLDFAVSRGTIHQEFAAGAEYVVTFERR